MQALSWVSTLLGYAFSFLSYGNSTYTQYQNMKFQQLQTAQRQAQVMRCPGGQRPQVINNYDGTYSVVCPPTP